MFQHQEQHAWIRHIKDLLCCHGFENIWNDQSVMNEKVFLAAFKQRLKDELFKNASAIFGIVIDVDCIKKLKLYLNVKVI